MIIAVGQACETELSKLTCDGTSPWT